MVKVPEIAQMVVGALCVALGTNTLFRDNADWRTYLAGAIALGMGLYIIWRRPL